VVALHLLLLPLVAKVIDLLLLLLEAKIIDLLLDDQDDEELTLRRRRNKEVRGVLILVILRHLSGVEG